MIETLRVVADDGAVTGARCAGRSGRALVFVHGVGSTAAIWDSQLEALGSEYRTLAVELRGNGALTDPDPALIARDGYAKDVLAVARAAGIDRFTIVGCSLGGVVAFELWSQVPERIEAMVLVGTFAHYPDASRNVEGILSAVRDAGDMAAFAAVRAAKLGLSPQRERETVDQMACKSVACYEAATRATWTGDYRAVLPTIDVPVLVISGERDTVAPYRLSQEIAIGIPGARLEVVEDAGHVTNADAPGTFNQLLREFLRGAPVA
ncbi:MAG TPA: alpha/beta fold hydrolase [Candidatus Acidoferrales bacterium]|nr:alpha/beta fold hydrolase [Candidatus Acidoferrales bacterium]